MILLILAATLGFTYKYHNFKYDLTTNLLYWGIVELTFEFIGLALYLNKAGII